MRGTAAIHVLSIFVNETETLCIFLWFESISHPFYPLATGEIGATGVKGAKGESRHGLPGPPGPPGTMLSAGCTAVDQS